MDCALLVATKMSPLLPALASPLCKDTEPASTASRCPPVTVILPADSCIDAPIPASPTVIEPTASPAPVPVRMLIAPGASALPVASSIVPLCWAAEPEAIETSPLALLALDPEPTAKEPPLPAAADPARTRTEPPSVWLSPAPMVTAPEATLLVSDAAALKLIAPLAPLEPAPACRAIEPPDAASPRPAAISMLPPEAPTPLATDTEPPTLVESALLGNTSPACISTSAPLPAVDGLLPAARVNSPDCLSALSPVNTITEPESLVELPDEMLTEWPVEEVKDVAPELRTATEPCIAPSADAPETKDTDPALAPVPARTSTDPPTPRSLAATSTSMPPLEPDTLEPELITRLPALPLSAEPPEMTAAPPDAVPEPAEPPDTASEPATATPSKEAPALTDTVPAEVTVLAPAEATKSPPELAVPAPVLICTSPPIAPDPAKRLNSDELPA